MPSKERIIKTASRFLVISTFAVSTLLAAQSVKVQQYPKAGGCDAAAAVAEQVIKAYPHPASWHYVVACDDAAWTHLIGVAAPGERAEFVYGATEPKTQLMILRGTRLVNPRAGEPTPNHIISYGLARIFLRDSDEVAAEQLSQRWMNTRNHFDETPVEGQ
jgi:hypothetical protein